MRKSTRALIGIVVLDALIVAGSFWLIWQIKSRSLKLAVPEHEAIQTITSTAGGAIGVITVVLAIAFVTLRRKGL